MTTTQALEELDSMAAQFIGHEKTNIFAQIAETIRAQESTEIQVAVTANDPSARELLRRAIKWIDRIENRRHELPPLFFDGCDPFPLTRDIREYLSNTDCTNRG